MAGEVAMVRMTVVLGLLTMGCGGDDVNVGGLSCGTDPCGGDPVGVWTIGATCLSGAPMIDQCPQADIRFSIDQEGTVTVSADMTYSVEATSAGFLRGTIPAECFQGQLTDCAQLNDEDTTCTGDASVECSCEATFSETVSESGTWSVNGNEITLDDGAGNIEINEFCVQGDAMSVHSTSDTEGIEFEILLSR